MPNPDDLAWVRKIPGCLLHASGVFDAPFALAYSSDCSACLALLVAAIRRRALEEAAKACEAVSRKGPSSLTRQDAPGSTFHWHACLGCAHEIRNLKPEFSLDRALSPEEGR